MDYRQTVSLTVAEMLREAGMDRFGVAAEMSRLTGKSVTKLMLDGYTAESRDTFNLPAYLQPALEVACRSTALTEWQARVRGGELLVGAATMDAEIGRLEHERDQAAERIKQLRKLRRRAG